MSLPDVRAAAPCGEREEARRDEEMTVYLKRSANLDEAENALECSRRMGSKGTTSWR